MKLRISADTTGRAGRSDPAACRSTLTTTIMKMSDPNGSSGESDSADRDEHHDESRRNEFDPEVAEAIGSGEEESIGSGEEE